MNVVLVALGPTAPGDGLVGGVQALRQAGAGVHLVSRLRPTPGLVAVLETAAPLPVRSGSPHPLGGATLPLRYPGPARTVQRGKLRLCPDRLPAARRLLRHPFTAELIAAADVLVALDQAAIPAVWWAARRHRSAHALHGLPAAVARHT